MASGLYYLDVSTSESDLSRIWIQFADVGVVYHPILPYQNNQGIGGFLWMTVHWKAIWSVKPDCFRVLYVVRRQFATVLHLWFCIVAVIISRLLQIARNFWIMWAKHEWYVWSKYLSSHRIWWYLSMTDNGSRRWLTNSNLKIEGLIPDGLLGWRRDYHMSDWYLEQHAIRASHEVSVCCVWYRYRKRKPKVSQSRSGTFGTTGMKDIPSEVNSPTFSSCIFILPRHPDTSLTDVCMWIETFLETFKVCTPAEFVSGDKVSVNWLDGDNCEYERGRRRSGVKVNAWLHYTLSNQIWWIERRQE